MIVDSKYYLHDTDRAALKALKAIPGFHQFIKAFMKIWNERQYRIENMSSSIRINERQLSEYYDMLPPICEKLGIEIPELYLELSVEPNAWTNGDTKPFITMTTGLLENMPHELIPTVLAHECGHIACHHVLYSTMGRIIKNYASVLFDKFVPFGAFLSAPLQIGFTYWMRCSELSADRAAVICDGTAEKMSRACMHFAGYDKDISCIANQKEFLIQAQDYKEMIKSSKWDKTLEFLYLLDKDHPLSAVRALECEEWANSETFSNIINGRIELLSCKADEEGYNENEGEDENEIIDESIQNQAIADKEDKKNRKLNVIGLIKKTAKEDNKDLSLAQIPDEIRKYKELYDEGIITEDEFIKKKQQLLNL